MQSRQSKLYYKAMRAVRKMATPFALQGQDLLSQKLANNATEYRPPKLKYESTLIEQLGYPVYEIGSGDKWILYLHGGAYVEQPSVFHWQYVERLVEQGFKVLFALYHKAPAFTCQTTVEQTVNVYLSNIARLGNNVTIMGDSAGGGLALAVAQQLCRLNKPLPRQLILYSPWLDVSCSIQGIQYYADKDWLFDLDSLRAFGSAYSGDLPVNNPLASPLYGGGLPCKTYIYVGSDEVMLLDCLKYKHINSHNHKLIVREFPYMQHCFAIMPMREADLVLYEVVDIIKQ